MKFSKHQKEILKKINEGKVFNITSYLETFNLRNFIKYDMNEVNTLFQNDPLPKKFYYPNNIPPRPSMVISENEFYKREKEHTLSPDKYNSLNINLSYTCGIQHKTLDGLTFTLDFYKGVYVSTCFDKIIEFLSLWQYLKSEMLILDAPYDPGNEDIGIFFSKTSSYPMDYLKNWQERIKDIDFVNHTYSDQHYLSGYKYIFSDEYFNICKEFWNRRIYKTAKLSLFIQKRFQTTEENMQNNALVAAWLAILVAVILPFLPIGNNDLKYIEDKIEQIESQLDATRNNTSTLPQIQSELTASLSSQKAEELMEKIDKISSLLENYLLQEETKP